VTSKPDLIFYFLAQIPIYVSCSGASSIYTSCKAVRECICGNIYNFGSGFIKKEVDKYAYGSGKRPSVQDSNGETNHSITLIDKKLHLLVGDESKNECVQQPKEIENCAYDNSEENEKGFESGEGTLPLCFYSFKTMKKNVSNHKSSRYDVECPK
jgi:hypothetical protein